MSLFVTSLVALFILGAFLQMMPSRRDKMQSQTRLSAMQFGFRPRLIVSELPSMRDEMQMVYEWMPPASKSADDRTPQQWILLRVEEESDQDFQLKWLEKWRFVSSEEAPFDAADRRLLPPLMAQLPRAVQAVQYTGEIIRFYWNGEENSASLPAMLAVAETLTAKGSAD